MVQTSRCQPPVRSACRCPAKTYARDSPSCVPRWRTSDRAGRCRKHRSLNLDLLFLSRTEAIGYHSVLRGSCKTLAKAREAIDGIEPRWSKAKPGVINSIKAAREAIGGLERNEPRLANASFLRFCHQPRG